MSTTGSDDPDLLADLIGQLPDANSPGPRIDLGPLLRAPTDLRAWVIRELVKADLAGALRAVFPDCTAPEQHKFLEGV